MSTLIAIISGLALMTIAIIDQGGIGVFLNLPSAMITMGGTLVAVFISYPLPQVVRVMESGDHNPQGKIEQVVLSPGGLWAKGSVYGSFFLKFGPMKERLGENGRLRRKSRVLQG